MTFEIPSAITGFVSHIAEDRALKATREFVQNNLISLDVGVLEPFDPETFWSATRPRSEGRKSHAWFFLREWNNAFEGLEPAEKLKLVQKFKDSFGNWKIASQDSASMAFHDETTAQRTINSCIFIKKYASEIAQLDFHELEASNQHDISLLKSDFFYAGLNNHGMFQDIALLVAHALGMADEEAESKAIQRLTAYFDSSFTSEGIHRENNPTYHLMVANYVHMVSDYLTQTDRAQDRMKLEKLLEQADEYAAYCLLPNGKFPPISDTKVEPVDFRRARRYFGDNYLVGATSKGRYGKLPAGLEFVAEESGYAIFRSGWDEKASYALFSAAYNDNYHKHSDELSLYVYAKEHAILAEAGPNGYQYSDPLTTYAFSSFAHNTLIVDNQGLPRIDDKAHLTTLRKLSDKIVEGKTQRYEGVTWTRTVDAIEWSNAGLLKVRDRVTSEEPRNFKLLWHLGADVTPIVRGNFIEIFQTDSNEKLAELYMHGSAVKSVRHMCGQMKPQVQGFAFPAMGKNVPASVVQFEFETADLTADWELRTQEFLLRDRGITPKSSQWKTYYAEKPVRYLLDAAEDPQTKPLLFVFSAVNLPNDFTYNYRASLTDFPGSVCYILDDFGDQGSYYLANGRNFSEFRSVQKTMASVMQQIGVAPENAYALGSSKGGAGAIIHGVSAGLKQVLAGGPQYKIGLFTNKPHPNILSYIAGGETEDDIEWADNAMYDVLKNANRDTVISVVVGKADGHYKYHVQPLVKDATDLGYNVRLLTLPGTEHSELGAVFRQFVGSFSKSLAEPNTVLPHAIAADKSHKVGVCVDVPADWVALAQLQKEGAPIGRPVRIRNGTAEWEVTDNAIYRVRIYYDDPNQDGRKAFGTAPVRGG